MKIKQRKFTITENTAPKQPEPWEESAQLLFVFGAPNIINNTSLIEAAKKFCPNAYIFGCSTAGEIYGTQVLDNTLIATTVHFENSQVKGWQMNIEKAEDSYITGETLSNEIPHSIPSLIPDKEDKLIHVLVLSDGLNINGSDLVRGLLKNLPAEVTVTGGLAGDGESFKETFVISNGLPQKNSVAILGLFGEKLKIGYGSLGGWDPFGPERLITRSKGNVLYEFDGQSALGLYKQYLGEHAKGLPATGLLFPISLRSKQGKNGVVRTILSVDEKEQSLTFAGDVPEGTYARLMKANFDRLIDGAVSAAKTSFQSIEQSSPDLALLISCVGRKLVLNQRIEEEVEGVKEVLGNNTALFGFYSYGEISPFASGACSELHNQTMTITTISEV
ncbi:MAG: FIST signal transduction protein [Ignavibacteriaceae bacterium]